MYNWVLRINYDTTTWRASHGITTFGRKRGFLAVSRPRLYGASDCNGAKRCGSNAGAGEASKEGLGEEVVRCVREFAWEWLDMLGAYCDFA